MTDELSTFAEKKAAEAENLPAFQGTKLIYIRNQVEKMLALIGRDSFFDQYTRHDMSHIDGMLEIAEWIIPEHTKEHMSKADWLMLVLAIYFHDMGMLVTRREYEKRNEDTSFCEYKSHVLDEELGREYQHFADVDGDRDRFLYQEYIRSQHASRIKSWISKVYYEQPPEECKAIVDEINDLLNHLDTKFRRDLGLVCESHHLYDLDNYAKYSTCARYGNSADERINLQYVAIILRTADILHITNNRTPSVQFHIINPNNTKSIIEWQKQMAVRAVAAKEPRNSDGIIDPSLPKDTIEITAYFNQPDQAEAFFGLSAYITYMRSEITKNHDWVQASAKTEGTVNYEYPWKYVDDEHVETEGFEPRKLQFIVDQENILQMLVGHTLYNDSSVVLRELVQNGIDAVKLQYCIENGQVPDFVNSGEVHISWDEKDRILTVSDNGTGMTIQEVENFLLRVGASKYRSESFCKKFPGFPAISRFGIGILTCFLIADDIDISTCACEESTANVISLRQVNGKYLLKKVSKSEIPPFISSHGTEISLRVRSDVDIQNILTAIQKWVLFPQCKVTLCTSEDFKDIGYRSPKEALIEYLNANRYIVDGKFFQVEEVCKNGITLAYALYYNKYLDEWAFFDGSFRSKSDIISPVGLCVEGIRVEFSTPGLSDESIIAVANTHNCSSVLTNVARSSIERNDGKESFLKDLYSCYADHIKSQMTNLQKTRSLGSAVAECKFLMRPLFESRHGREILQSSDAFFRTFDEIKSILMEKDGKVEVASVQEVEILEHVYIIDSLMFSAAIQLFREIQSSAALSTLINSVSTDICFPTEIPIIYDYDSTNVLHRRALRSKQASRIVVYKQQRRVDIQFSFGSQRWDTYNTDSIQIHVPIVDIDIEGLSNEFGVYTVNGIYLSHKNIFTKYLKDLLGKINCEQASSDKYLASTLLSIACNERLLRFKSNNQNEYNNDVVFSNFIQNGMYNDLLWEKIDRKEFIEKLFQEEYILYRPQDWSRNSHNDD